jgi:Zn-dependent membrane protease YugP
MAGMSIVAFFYLMSLEYWILTLVLAIPALIAAARVKTTFAKFAKVGTRSGISGAQAAEMVMRSAGVQGVTIEPHQGMLTDHYDPRAKALRLSPQVYNGKSVSAVAVAAHEAGHAIQDATNYVPLRLRSAIVPATQFGSRIWLVPFLIGIFTSTTGWLYVGVALFALTVLFQLITLPTEFNASSRAKVALAETGIVSSEAEAAGVSKVLNAAAMTYVAAAVTAIIHLLYLLMVASRD